MITDTDYRNDELLRTIKRLENRRSILRAQIAHIQSARAYRFWQKFNSIKKELVLLLKNPKNIPFYFHIVLSKGPKYLFQKLIQSQEAEKFLTDLNTQYRQWFQLNFPTKEELETQKLAINNFVYKPLISIITPTFNTPPKYLEECISSVISQSYENWELCIVDDNSTDLTVRKIIKKYAKIDQRIKYNFNKSNENISKASNKAVKLANGEWLGFLDHDDYLWPNALYEIVKLINERPKTDFIYTDEDKISEDGQNHCDPFFKPNWSPDTLRSFNYITHFTVLKKSLFNEVGGFTVGLEGSQDYDLILKATERAKSIAHIQKVLYSWRKIPNSTASNYLVKPAANQAAINSLEQHLFRNGNNGTLMNGVVPGTFRVKWEIVNTPLVSIIIPTKNNFKLLRKCIQSVLIKSTYKNYELVIVDTGSTESRVIKYYKQLSKSNPKIKILKWNKSFNYSAVNNFAASKSDGEYLLFLNNDTEVITADWIESLLEHAQRSEIGAVGAKLLYPHGRIQHAGIILGIKGGNIELGVAGHFLKGYPDEPLGSPIGNQKDVIRNCSGVTAACMMISKSKFNEVGGFEEKLVIAFNDVDLNLKLLKNKYLNTYTPFAKLYHHESVSVGTPENQNRDITQFDKEINFMLNKWKSFLSSDCYYNENFDLSTERINLKL